MRSLVCIAVLAVAALARAAPSTPQDVSHSDIRDAIISLGRMVRDVGDRIDQHEQREKNFSEQLKKALGGLGKQLRASDQAVDALSGAVAQLDERLRNIEAMIKQMEKPGSLQAMESALTQRMDTIALKLDKLEANSQTSSCSNIEMENLRSATAKLASTDAKVEHSTTETERILSQYEARLSEFSRGAPAAAAPVDNQDWHPVFLGALESHQKILQDLRQVTQGTANNLSSLAHTSDMWTATNATHNLLQDIKYHLESGADKGVAKLEEKLSEAHSALARGQEEVMKSVSDASVVSKSLYGDVTKIYEQLLKEVEGLAKVEQVMIQTADNVTDSKSRVEYGVHQILLAVGNLPKLQSKELNATIYQRFDNISGTLLENHKGALTNLSSKIEMEISQVWKQIGIIHQQLTPVDNQDWHPVFLGALESHQKILQDLRQVTQGTASDLSFLAHTADLWTATNATHNLLQDIKYHLESGADKGVAKLEEKLSEAHSAFARRQEQVMKSVSDASVISKSLYGDVTKSYEQLLKEVEGLAKVEQVMIQTADNVTDTKSRVEYRVHQILLEVGNLLKLQSKELNATINQRFDNISGTLLENHKGALTNISSKIEMEINQMRQQIGIIHQQLTVLMSLSVGSNKNSWVWNKHD